MNALGAIAVAGGASVALNVSYVIQHGALGAAPPVRARHPIQTARGLLASRRWVVGAGCGYLGLALNVAAMTLAPLWLVQATLAAGLAAASSVWSRATGQPLGTGQRAALALLAGGVVALGLAGAHGRSGVHASPPALAAFAATLGLVAAAVVGRHATSSPWRLGLAAGLFYGITTVALAALVASVHRGMGAAPTALLAASIGGLSVAGGFLAFQRGLQTGAIAPVVTLMTAGMNAVAMLGGLSIGGGLAASGQSRGLQLAGLVALCAASALAAGGLIRPRPAVRLTGSQSA